MATTPGTESPEPVTEGRNQGRKGKPVAVVKFGSASVPVYRCQSGKRVRFVIAYYRKGKRLRQFFGNLDDAKKEARFVAQRIQSGMQHVADMAPHDRDAYQTACQMIEGLGIPLVAAIEDYVRAREIAGSESLAAMASDYSKHFAKVVQRATVPDLVEHLLASKKEDGAGKRHLASMRSVLRRFAEAHPGAILDVTSSEIDGWLRALKVSPITRNSMLLYINLLFSFARERNCLPEGKATAASQVRKVKVSGVDVEIFTPSQFKTILDAAPMHLVPILAIGAFAGIRRAELNRLDWSAIDLDRGIIELRAKQAKTASRRIVPVTDNLRAWLEPFPRQGKVVASAGLFSEATAFARALNIEWPNNVLRHSFISYRIAKVKSADQVALEAGNSPAIIFKHYRELTTEEQANEWFSIMPKEGQWENTFQYDRLTQTVTLPKKADE